MKVPYSWLREWVEVPWDAAELGQRLTMAGFELEAIESASPSENNNNAVLELNVTPNRGDAMSILGIAREVAALAGKTLESRKIEPVTAQSREAALQARKEDVAPQARTEDNVPVRLSAPQACPKFVGRVIRGIDHQASSPPWLRERLQRCGIRSINPIVDVTNYVMLELGTPMHAYDLAKLKGGIDVRMALAGEKLRLLDGQEVTLDPSVLVIADEKGAVGIAGVMGGERTAVSDTTTDVFFEVAFFKPEVIGACARRYGLITDAAQRFERGVDAEAQENAVERASRLLTEVAGGLPGPTMPTVIADKLPRRHALPVRRQQIARLIGVEIPDTRVVGILKSLGMAVRDTRDGWEVTPPSHRFDIAIEADIVEEVARIFGYDAVPEQDARIAQTFDALPEGRLTADRALTILADRGYQEAITYSFVEPRLQELLFPGIPQLSLKNPIATNMAAMRVSLWPGLLLAASENLSRQQERVRLFEQGKKFLLDGGELKEIATLAGVAAGNAVSEQWGEKKRPVDFFDVKADCQALIDATGCATEFEFRPDSLSCLHPGRTARILRNGHAVGWLGELHPETVKGLDLTYTPLLFELETDAAFASKRPVFEEISKYPSIRRDLAIVVDEDIPLAAIRENIAQAASSLLRELKVFDIYRGQGIDSGRKSIALGLILQESSRTLADQDADRVVAAVAQRLQRELNALIRDK